MRQRPFLMLLLMAILALSCSNRPEITSAEFLYKNNPVGLISFDPPTFPNRSVSIVEYGAVGDGLKDNTAAFADAIQAIHQKGGGYVDVPEGLWSTGPIELKDGVCLRTQSGTLVLFSSNFDQYPLVQTYYEGAYGWRAKAPIYARDAKNIGIVGAGIFDGNGDVWRPMKQGNVNRFQWRDLLASGGVLNEDASVWYPTQSALEGSQSVLAPGERSYEQSVAIKVWLRPVMLNFISCTDVLIEGVQFRNSPAWCLHPVLCNNVTIRNIRVKNDDWAANGDALDIESCSNVLVTDSHFDAGDDGICLKSGKDAEGRARGVPTQNVRIHNCTVYNGHGGFVVGSEMSGGVRNVYLSDCRFTGTDNGLRFKSTRGRGGVVENIHIERVYMSNIKRDAILYDLYYGNKGNDTVVYEVNEGTPQFRNIFMQDIYCKGAQRAALFQGLPEMHLENIVLKNAVLEAKEGLVYKDLTNVRLQNVIIQAHGKPEVQYEEVDLATL
ncbi:MAG: glycoside hydrolase family 28 protein [Bacteroidales bacterium]|nr:glycoside hydrolase family 28 protein [Bacteroidales bacterium]